MTDSGFVIEAMLDRQPPDVRRLLVAANSEADAIGRALRLILNDAESILSVRPLTASEIRETKLLRGELRVLSRE
jgi:hypothetical protein